MTLRQELIEMAKANEHIMREARESVKNVLPYLESEKTKGKNFTLLRTPLKRSMIMEYALKEVLSEYGYELEWMPFKKYHKITWKKVTYRVDTMKPNGRIIEGGRLIADLKEALELAQWMQEVCDEEFKGYNVFIAKV